MKKLLSVSFCIAMLCTMLVGLTGCPKKDTTTDVKKELKASTASPDKQKITQGKEATTKISYTLGADAAVKSLSAKCDPDKAVTVTFSPEKLEKGKSGDVTVTLKVADDAKVGDATVTVTAHGDGAVPATVDTKITVTVEKK